MAKSKEEVVQEFRIQSIQDAAMRVIARKGMAAATMQDIAEEAGVAKGTIYLYFRDRDELVEKTFESAITGLGKRIDEAWASLALFIIEGSNALVIERVMEDAPPPEQEDVELIAGVILDGISTRKSSRRSIH